MPIPIKSHGQTPAYYITEATEKGKKEKSGVASRIMLSLIIKGLLVEIQQVQDSILVFDKPF